MGEHELKGSGASGSDPADEAMDRAIADVKLFRLLRKVALLICSGIGIGGLYADLGADMHRFWWGSALAFLGAALGVVGFVAKWREVSRSGRSTARHYPLILLAGTLIFLGAYLPPFSLR